MCRKEKIKRKFNIYYKKFVYVNYSFYICRKLKYIQMSQDKKHIYVCLSECKQVVKVGITYDLGTRVTSLKTDEGQPFKVLFCSELILTADAKKIEKAVNDKFNEYIVKGKEWYSINPIIIIEFLIKELNIKPYELNTISHEFPIWNETVQTYNSYKEREDNPYIKELQSKGRFCISYLTGNNIKYIGFCNYGDAKNFYYRYKHFIIIANEFFELFYNTNRYTLSTFGLNTRKNVYSMRERLLEVKEKLDKIVNI